MISWEDIDALRACIAAHYVDDPYNAVSEYERAVEVVDRLASSLPPRAPVGPDAVVEWPPHKTYPRNR